MRQLSSASLPRFDKKQLVYARWSQRGSDGTSGFFALDRVGFRRKGLGEENVVLLVNMLMEVRL